MLSLTTQNTCLITTSLLQSFTRNKNTEREKSCKKNIRNVYENNARNLEKKSFFSPLSLSKCVSVLFWQDSFTKQSPAGPFISSMYGGNHWPLKDPENSASWKRKVSTLYIPKTYFKKHLNLWYSLRIF